MADALYFVLTLLFFAASIGLVTLCQRLMEENA